MPLAIGNHSSSGYRSLLFQERLPWDEFPILMTGRKENGSTKKITTFLGNSFIFQLQPCVSYQSN